MPIYTMLIAVALKTALLLATAVLVCRLLASRSSACRHLLWTLTLALSLVLPFAAVMLPAWFAVALPWLDAGLGTPPAAAAVAGEAWPVQSAIAGMWVSGVIVLLARQVFAAAALRRLVRDARPAPAARWMAAWIRIRRDHRVVRGVRVLESQRMSSPCTWGVLRPTLLLPACGEDWPESRRRQALLHELAHLRRFDHVSGAIARLACALHWYNPLVWLAARQLKLLQEQACDDAVLRSGGAPCEYAQFLVDLAGQGNGDRELPISAIGMARPSLLRERVVAILDPRRARPALQALEACSIGLTMSGLALLLATTRVAAHDVPRSLLQQPTPLPAISALAALPAIPPSGWTADFMGRIYLVRTTGQSLSFDLGNGEGNFLGRLHDGDKVITGHWTPPNSKVHGFRYAAPLKLDADGTNRWRGDVNPRHDEFTLYLMVAKRPDGTIGAFLRNPERNIGVFNDVDHLERSGDTVRLIGRERGAKVESVLFTAQLDRENGILSLPFPDRGGTYDLRRDLDPDSGFFPRGRTPDRYVYRPPPPRNDGWPTASVTDVDIDRGGIERLVQMVVDMPIESVHTPEIQGILIARHGKLVLEEYFHGEHRDKLHETRSAAKSLTATLIGAAIEDRMPVALSTPVYETMFDGKVPPDAEPRKRAMTLEHLLMMRSGFFCDDSNSDAPGNEDKMLEQEDEADYYRYTLRLPLDRDPGAKGVYCSIDPNLALGVLERATGQPVMDSFDRLLGGPLKITTYAWPLSPAGQPYGGGGIQFLPRDFMKIGQLMLNGGTWQGRRILGNEFVARASAPLHELHSIKYGLLWWSLEYPYKDRTVRAFFAGGNGGQGVIVIPELDLVVATFGGNYADRVGLYMQQELTPNQILPAVREQGDDSDTPVTPGNFETPYG